MKKLVFTLTAVVILTACGTIKQPAINKKPIENRNYTYGYVINVTFTNGDTKEIRVANFKFDKEKSIFYIAPILEPYCYVPILDVRYIEIKDFLVFKH